MDQFELKWASDKRSIEVPAALKQVAEIRNWVRQPRKWIWKDFSFSKLDFSLSPPRGNFFLLSASAFEEEITKFCLWTKTARWKFYKNSMRIARWQFKTLILRRRMPTCLKILIVAVHLLTRPGAIWTAGFCQVSPIDKTNLSNLEFGKQVSATLQSLTFLLLDCSVPDVLLVPLTTTPIMHCGTHYYIELVGCNPKLTLGALDPTNNNFTAWV